MITCKAYAKVNLYLNVLGKRQDGYHDLEMINAKIDLFDTISLEETTEKEMVLIQSNDIFLSTKNNIVFDCALYMLHRFSPEKGVKITIDKHIPFGAGLAGNSADVAGIISGMNQLFSLNLSLDEMKEIGLQFGADIPYCFHDRPALVEGVGETITELEIDLSKLQVFLIHPRIYVSTNDVFRYGDKHGFKNHSKDQIMKTIADNNILQFKSELFNSLQETTLSMSTEMKDFYSCLCDEIGKDGLTMTGSGSTFIKLIQEVNDNLLSFQKRYREKYFMNIYHFL